MVFRCILVRFCLFRDKHYCGVMIHHIHTFGLLKLHLGSLAKKSQIGSLLKAQDYIFIFRRNKLQEKNDFRSMYTLFSKICQFWLRQRLNFRKTNRSSKIFPDHIECRFDNPAEKFRSKSAKIKAIRKTSRNFLRSKCSPLDT